METSRGDAAAATRIFRGPRARRRRRLPRTQALAERVDCPIRLKPGELSYEKPTHKGSPTYHGYVAGTISRANRERAAELYKADYALYKRLAAMDRADLVAGGLARGKDGPPYFSLDAQELVG